jgi:hypothetical protein
LPANEANVNHLHDEKEQWLHYLRESIEQQAAMLKREAAKAENPIINQRHCPWCNAQASVDDPLRLNHEPQCVWYTQP